MAKYSIDSSTLTEIADAIRTQYGEDSPIAVSDMAEAILGIEGGGGESQFNVAATVLMSESQTLEFYHDLGKAPRFFIVFISDISDVVGKHSYRFVAGFGFGIPGFIATSNSNSLRSVTGTTNSFAADENTMAYTVTNGTYRPMVGVEYSCIYW